MRVLELPSILLGGLGENFSHAFDAEESLNGKYLSNPQTLRDVMNALDGEITTEDAYLRHLAKALVYKVSHLSIT